MRVRSHEFDILLSIDCGGNKGKQLGAITYCQVESNLRETGNRIYHRRISNEHA